MSSPSNSPDNGPGNGPGPGPSASERVLAALTPGIYPDKIIYNLLNKTPINETDVLRMATMNEDDILKNTINIFDKIDRDDFEALKILSNIIRKIVEALLRLRINQINATTHQNIIKDAGQTVIQVKNNCKSLCSGFQSVVFALGK